MLMAIWDANTSLLASHDFNSHVAPHFGCLDLRNVMAPLAMPSAPHDAYANANGITWPKISCSSFQLCWPKNCLGDIADAITIIWHWHQCNWYHTTKLHLISIIFTQGMQWCNFVLLTASCDPNPGANGITRAKSHVAPHFDHLELTNAVVALIILLVSCDTDTSMNCITWQKRYVIHCFNHLYTWYWYQCQQCQMTEKVMLQFISVILN